MMSFEKISLLPFIGPHTFLTHRLVRAEGAVGAASHRAGSHQPVSVLALDLDDVAEEVRQAFARDREVGHRWCRALDCDQERRLS